MEYINFEKCWNDIKLSYEGNIDDIDDENIKDFILFHRDKELNLDTDECSLNDNQVTFYFSKEYQTANESDNQNEWLCVLISYNLDNEEFTWYETEQR